jgi:uncharacterized protein (DUF2062 family)
MCFLCALCELCGSVSVLHVSHMIDQPSNTRTLDPRAILRRILSTDDSPHAIALGAAVGMFVACTPTLGIRMAIVAILTTYLSNPVTAAPLYYFDYWIGSRFVSGSASREDFARVLDFDGFAEWWQAVHWLVIEVGTPLVVGSLIVAIAASLVTYPTTRWLIARTRSA